MGTVGDFVENHVKPAQTVVALLVGVIALVGAVIGGVKWAANDSDASMPAVSTPNSLRQESVENPDGWGPARQLFTTEKPASYPVLNSITNNPAWGDERNFVRVRVITTTAKFSDMVRAEPGEDVEVIVIASNNCANNLAATGAVTGLWMQLVSKVVGTDLWFQVSLGGENVPTVYNGATVITGAAAKLEVLQGSGRMETGSSGKKGFAIDAAALADGRRVLLGETGPDGYFPVGMSPLGMEMGGGFATFRFKVVEA